jgi:hypothetical protein
MIAQSRRDALRASLTFLVLPLTLMATPSRAQEKLEAADRNNLEMGYVVMPVARDGKLDNYIFITFNVRMQDVASADFVREQHFLVRDALTKLTARNPIPAGKGPNTYDAGAVRRSIATAITSVKPGLRVLKVNITRVEFMRR